MKKFLLILLVVAILLLANTSYAAEVSQENGKAILTLRGPDSIKLDPGEEITRRYAVTLQSKSSGRVGATIESPELWTYDKVSLEPYSSERLDGYYTFTEADEGEVWISASTATLFVELMVTVEVREKKSLGIPEYPEFMWSARFFELMEQFGFDEAVLRWNEEYGRR
jgi:hypothetical protein